MDAQQQKIVSEIDYAIGDRVNTLSRRKGFNKTTLGRQFGLSPSAMSLKLNGYRSWSALDIKRAADVVGTRMAVLLGEEPMPEPTLPATVTPLDIKPAVGPEGLEPPASTVEYRELATVTPIRGRTAA